MKLHGTTPVLRLSSALSLALVSWTLTGCVQFEDSGLGPRPGIDDQKDRAHDDHSSDAGEDGILDIGTGTGGGLPNQSSAGSGTSGTWTGDSSGVETSDSTGAGEDDHTQTSGGGGDETESTGSTTSTSGSTSGNEDDGSSSTEDDGGLDESSDASSDSGGDTDDDGVVPGSLAKGERCAGSAECRSGHCVPVGIDPSQASDSPGSEGICSDCSQNDDCEQGLCRRLGDDFSPATCELSDLGENCRSHGDCLDARLCDLEDGENRDFGRCQDCLADADCPSELYCEDEDQFGLRACEPRWSKQLGEACPVRDGHGLDAACATRYCTLLPEKVGGVETSASCSSCKTHSDCSENEQCSWDSSGERPFKRCIED